MNRPFRIFPQSERDPHILDNARFIDDEVFSYLQKLEEENDRLKEVIVYWELVRPEENK